jgi:beta-alanine--pyruvate transaminase
VTAAHGLKGLPGVLDIRTIGLVAGIDLEPVPGAPGKRAFDAMDKGFHEFGTMVRITADTLALSPPLIISRSQIAELFDTMARLIRALY